MYVTFFLNKTESITNEEYSIDDLFAGREFTQPVASFTTRTDFTTKTIKTNQSPNYHSQEKLREILTQLQTIANRFDRDLINDQYDTFYIPKKSGGLREINAPMPELMEALREMKQIFQYRLNVLYHNAAYAYTPNRNIVDALKVHQKNNSRWYLKLDIKDFFPSCSQEFVVKMLKQIYPFTEYTEDEINSFIWICFRNNELPQGTPMSPMLTNLIMVPVDYMLQQYAYDKRLCYTRYADDMLISAYNDFIWHETTIDIDNILHRLETPFRLKREKTRYGSSAGRNWNLGLMVNKDNNITVGYRKKKLYRAMLYNLLNDESNNIKWSKEQLYHFQGITAYYLSVEPEYFSDLINKYETKFDIRLRDIYKEEL